MPTQHHNTRPLLRLGAILLVAVSGCRDLPTGAEPFGALFTQVASGPVVNSLADPGTGYSEESAICDDTECTLREAIDFAEPGATITFAPGLTGTIALADSWGGLLINKSLTIVGPGASTLTVDGQMSQYGIAPFVISDQYSAEKIQVEIRGLTITGGNEGGLVIEAQQVLLDGVVVTGNTRADWIYGGAGIHHHGGALTLRNSAVVGNTSSGHGGGIASYEGILTLENSTVSGNSTDGCFDGGGIRTMPTATLTLTNSTVSGNTACHGAGILVSDGGATIEYSTVANNTGPDGAGIVTYGPLVLTSSIVAGNTGVDLANFGAGTTVTYSLLGSTDGSEFSGSNNLLGASPLLGPLASNGGPTQTHALLSGSPAINYVPPGTNGCGTTITTDQRATARPQPAGGACDAGAFEHVSSFTQSCTYTINPKNGQRAVTVSWADAEPGVTKVEIADGRVATKQMAPTASGSWSTNTKTDPTYGIWGGTSRKDNATVLVPAATACTLQS